MIKHDDVIQLRPKRSKNLILMVLIILLVALCIGALTTGSFSLGIFGLLLLLPAFLVSLSRLLNPKSYLTELNNKEFKVYDSLGRLVHNVSWHNIEAFMPKNLNGLRGPGADIGLGWRCNPRKPGKGWQPWAKGGKDFDGYLPDPYKGIEKVAALFEEYMQKYSKKTGTKL